ncbi:unnamed protein product [Pleuronectes platessa]|uniref:Uncharacterized protein n=1 Tax=Pleuronectes platessa TaxID=8262 RepID=A0A9N7YZW9_PLEPL|nr:unnamed protein product [Pleuronectes platessa]
MEERRANLPGEGGNNTDLYGSRLEAQGLSTWPEPEMAHRQGGWAGFTKQAARQDLVPEQRREAAGKRTEQCWPSLMTGCYDTRVWQSSARYEGRVDEGAG